VSTPPRWQKVLSDLWVNRSRSLLVVASIAVGLFAIGVIATLYMVIAQDMRTAYISVNPANIYIQAAPMDDDLIGHLRSIEGVRQVEGVRVVDLRIQDSKNAWQSLRLQAVKDWTTMPLNRLIVQRGQWPPREGEVVIDQHRLPELGVDLGGLVQVELPDGKTRTLKLVGVTQDLTIGAFSGGGGYFDAPVMAYIDRDSLDELDQSPVDQYNALYATIQGDGSDLTAVSAVAVRLNKAIKDQGITVQTSRSASSAEHPNAYLINAIVGILLVLGLLVVFLSGFLITSTLQSLLGQQVQQIGIMKSVGARWMQVAGIYMALIFIFGVIAFVVAAPLVQQVSFFVLNMISSYMNFVLQGQRIILPAVILQAVLALGMPQIAAWAPIWKGTRISVQEALSGVSAGSPGAKKGAHPQSKAAEAAPRQTGGIKNTFTRVLSRPMLISLRNTFRRKGRLALTLLTLTLGGAIFIATFNVQVSMNKYIDQVSQYFLSDVSVTLDRPYRVAQVQGLLAGVPGVGRVEGWATASCQLLQEDGSAGDRVGLLAPPAGSSLVKPVVTAGRWIQPGDRNAITLSDMFTNRYPDLKVGDTLELQVNGKKTDWKVVGFFRLAGKNGGFTAYTSYDYLSGLTGMSNRAIIYQVVAAQPNLTPEAQDQMAEAIEAKLKTAGMEVSDLTTGSYMSDVAGSGFGILTLVLLFLAILTAMVGSIGLAGTMSMNVMERTREIGVLRAIGASDRTLIKMVLVEGMLIGAISYVLGAVLAFPISKLLSDGISQAIFDAPSTLGFTPLGFGIWLALVIVLSFFASVIPARSASRLTIREVLAYE
jgi:putative ABC transport system permease protein